MLWLYLHFTHLPIDLLERGTETRQPLALHLPGQSRVQWINQLAADAGVLPGQRLNTAHCLCPELAIQSYAPERSLCALRELAQWAGRYSGFISLAGDNGLWLEVGTMRRLFGGLPGLYDPLSQDLQHQGLRFHAALGYTPLAARWLARHVHLDAPSEDAQRMLTQLRQLPLDASDIDPHLQEKMQRMGLHTLGQLLDLPKAELAPRFGQPLIQMLNQLMGTLPHPLPAYQPPAIFERRLDFISEISTLAQILFALRKLLVELMGWLRTQLCGTDQLQLTLYHRDGPPTHCTCGTAQAEYRDSEFLALARLQLEQPALRESLAERPICGIRLRVEQRQSLAESQTELFRHPGQETQKHAQLIARLQAKLGPQAVQQLVIRDDYRPEHAWNYQAPRSLQAGTCPPPAGRHILRPLWLLATPLPLHHTTRQLLQGPERLCSGWWDNHPVMRDYYVARLGSQQAWIFRDEHNRWFIHGWFA